MRELSFSSPIVVVHAHPDDETLTSGALLATACASSVPVTLVTCTRGEQGEVIGDDPLALEGNPAALGEFRETELAAAMAALGVTDHLFLDQLPIIFDDSNGFQHQPGVALGQVGDRNEPVRYVDSGMSWVSSELGAGSSALAQLGENVPEDAFYFSDLNRAARSLALLVIARSARTLVTYEPGGGYGHPDHVRSHDLVVRTRDLLRKHFGVEVQILVALKPTQIAVKAREALQMLGAEGKVQGTSEGGIIPELDEGYGSEASHSPETVFFVRTDKVTDAVFGSMRNHKTQIKWASPFAPVQIGDGVSIIGSFALSNDVIAPVLSHEFYCDLASL